MWGENKQGQRRRASLSLCPSHSTTPGPALVQQVGAESGNATLIFLTPKSRYQTWGQSPKTPKVRIILESPSKVVITEQDTRNPHPAPCSLHPRWEHHDIPSGWAGQTVSLLPHGLREGHWFPGREILSVCQDGSNFSSVSPPPISTGATSCLRLLRLRSIFPHFSKDFFLKIKLLFKFQLANIY